MFKTLVLCWLSFCLPALLSSAFAGGYEVTDSDGNLISDKADKTIRLGPEDKVIILNDSNKDRVFELRWDAGKRSIAIKGDNVHLKVYSSGAIEKWSPLEQKGEREPVLIQPVIPVIPRSRR